MVEEIRSMISDRSLSERQRLALSMALRLALRGKHISSTRLPAVSTATQSFVKARELLDAGLSEIARSDGPDEPDPEEE